MKKILCILISLICLLSLCGCGRYTSPEADETVNTAADLMQFEGQWSMTHLIDSNQAEETVPTFQISLVITGSDALAVIAAEDGTQQTLEMRGTFENGTLTLTEILSDSEPTVWTVQLLKDGNMRLQDDSVFIFLTPIMPLMMAE